VPSAELFNQFYEIGCSRLVYQTLLASMRTVEERQIRPMLKSKLPGLLEETLSEEQAEQLSAARRALVYGTLARAMRERLIVVTDQGVQVVSLGLIRRQDTPTDRQIERAQAYFDDEFTQARTDLVGKLAEPLPEPSPGARVSPIINQAVVGF
jgi:hypothetical protein